MASEDEINDMPAPPDLGPLFQAQTDQLTKAHSQASVALKVFAERDAAIGQLTDTYQQEIIAVHTIAKAVTTPPTALAAIAPVLAAANAAFAQAPITEQSVRAMIVGAFAALK
jgi:hypothetical protein